MVQVDPKTYLRLVEKAKTLAFVDIEATGLNGDYNSVVVVSVKPYGEKPISIVAERPGDDRKVVTEAKRLMEQFDAWVTYYGKGFDRKMLDTRLWFYRKPPIDLRHHIDLYFMLKYKINTSRKSQAHLLRFLGTLEQKMDMGANDWNKILANPKRWLPKMQQRCESDVIGLEGLYERSKHLIRDIKLG